MSIGAVLVDISGIRLEHEFELPLYCIQDDKLHKHTLECLFTTCGYLMAVSDVLTTLRGRLPELEWQLNKPGLSFSPKFLPAGLFRVHDEDPSCYVAEIKADIIALSTHPNPRIVRYLAEKINQKINVLVTVCAAHNRLKPDQELTGFIVEQLNTRRQWLQSMEEDIERLEEQKNALLNALTEKDTPKDCTISLNLQKELGELEKRLTLAREAYSRATS